MPACHARIARPGIAAALFAIVILALPVSAVAQPPAGSLVIGVKEAPPFAIRGDDGTWTGISVELWESIADELSYEFEWHEADLEGLLAGVESGALDAGVAAVTVTPERESVMDFTHPFHVSGLGIAVSNDRRAGWLAVIEQFFSLAFLQVIAGLTVLLLVVGSLVWMFERRRNPEQFGGPPVHGVGAGFWWSAVTMTTVGYGDKAPQTVGGRVVALLWMFAALIVISSFTASITASLTVNSLETGIDGPEDLPDVRIGSVAASTSAEYLGREGLPFTTAATIEEALAALDTDEVEAVVYDLPILQFQARQRATRSVAVLPVVFEGQMYALALPSGSPLREPINRALLGRTTSTEWRDLLDGYLGVTR